MTIIYLDSDPERRSGIKERVFSHFEDHIGITLPGISEFQRSYPGIQPNVVIQCASDPDEQDSLQLVQNLKTTFVRARVIILDMGVDHPIPYFSAGASGFVSWKDGPAELKHCIETVMIGRRFVGNEATLRLLDTMKI